MSLPARTLYISHSAFRELEKNVWSDRFARAEMSDGSKREPVLVRYRGGHTRNYPKRSYEIVRRGRVYHYNAEFDDPSLIRNALSFAFFAMLGVPAPKAEHVAFGLNGESRGVYLEIEGVGKPFFRRRRLSASSLFYAVNGDADFGLDDPETGLPKRSLLSGYEFRFGSEAEKAKLKSFIAGLHELGGSRGIAFVRKRLDANHYMKWLAGAVLAGNYDGFEQNYAIYRSCASGKYRLIPWDYEGSWGRNCYGKPADVNLVSAYGYNFLTRKLLGDPAMKLRYKATLRRALDGAFTESRLMPTAKEMLARISTRISEDSARKWSFGEFLGEAEVIRRYIRERRDAVAAELRRT